MRYIVTAEEMQALDRATIDEIGLPGAVLMETAGRAVAEVALDEARECGGGAVAVVCGGGNNGGDGYVIARVLHEAGARVVAYLASAREKVSGDAAIHLRAYEQVGGVVASIADAVALDEHRRAIESAAVVVDAVFGTGLDREVEGRYRSILEVIDRGSGRVVAVDMPSGVSADTGQPLGVCVTADRTVTMAFLKIGLVVEPGFARCGEVTVAEIGIPRQLARVHGVRAALVERTDVSGWLPPLAPTDHKGRRGHALVVAGSPGKRGAGRLAAWSALRAGAGLVTLAAPPGDGEIGVPDPVMSEDLVPDVAGAVTRLASLARGKRVVAMGPGMPTGEGGRDLVLGALSELDAPLVLDADALNHIDGDLEQVAASRPPVVLTPHPGEAARLLGCTVAEIQADRLAAARRLAEEARAVVVLKGARTLVCDGIAADGFVTVNPTGTPGLASAGTGDVLTGVVTGLIAQGAAPADAARAAVYLHGVAGEVAAALLGARSVTASDVIDALPEAFALVEDEEPGEAPAGTTR